MKVTVTIKHTETTTLDIGDLPAGLVRDLLVRNDGSFDGNWTLSDTRATNEWAVDSIEVEEEGS